MFSPLQSLARSTVRLRHITSQRSLSHISSCNRRVPTWKSFHINHNRIAFAAQSQPAEKDANTEKDAKQGEEEEVAQQQEPMVKPEQQQQQQQQEEEKEEVERKEETTEEIQQQQQQQQEEEEQKEEEEEQQHVPPPMTFAQRLFRPRNWILPGLFLLFLLYYVLDSWKEEQRLEIQVARQGSQQKRTLAVGKAAIGGSFTLVDTEGRPLTDSEFRGKWMMLYFGFTNCPDICPEEMKKMSRVLDMLPKQYSDKIQPIFISCDPPRDSCAAVKEYLDDFHPRFIGLTGTPEQIKNACRKYRVYYMAPDYEKDKEDYLVDHSVFIYFMDPYGYFNTYYAANMSADEIRDSVKSAIDTFDKDMQERKRLRELEKERQASK